MNKTIEARKETSRDVVLEEVWRIKAALSASYGHDIDRLFQEARKRQKRSGHEIVSLQPKRSGGG